MQGKNTTTQSEMLAKELLAIAPDVTKADRVAFMKDNDYGKATLSKYLNGQVMDNDTAVLIIKYMRKRIAGRYAQIGK